MDDPVNNGPYELLPDRWRQPRQLNYKWPHGLDPMAETAPTARRSETAHHPQVNVSCRRYTCLKQLSVRRTCNVERILSTLQRPVTE